LDPHHYWSDARLNVTLSFLVVEFTKLFAHLGYFVHNLGSGPFLVGAISTGGVRHIVSVVGVVPTDDIIAIFELDSFESRLTVGESAVALQRNVVIGNSVEYVTLVEYDIGTRMPSSLIDYIEVEAIGSTARYEVAIATRFVRTLVFKFRLEVYHFVTA
jgi:hypothetical protein